MKITCTKREQDYLIELMAAQCRCDCGVEGDCEDCLKNGSQIEWTIEGDKKQNERPHGKWVKETPLREVCPFCKAIRTDSRHNYCGVCGADLRGDDNG